MIRRAVMHTKIPQLVRNEVVLAAVITSVLVLFGVPLRTALLNSFVICVLCTAGYQVLSICVPSTPRSIEWLLGPGFAVGVVLWVVPVQLLGSGSVLNLTVFAAFTAFAVSRLPASARALGTPLMPSETKHILWMFGFAFIILSREWPWLVVVGVLLIVAGLVQVSNTFARRGIAISVVLMASLALLWWVRRTGDFWWVITDDYSYLEALRVHLSTWGIWTPWGPTNIASYHWLSPAWIAQVTEVTLADDWMVATRVAPIIFAVSIAAVTMCLVDHFSGRSFANRDRTTLTVLLTFIFLVLGLDLSGTSTFAVFSIGPSTVLIFAYAIENRLHRRGLLLSGVMLIGTVFAKVFAIPAVLLVLCLLIAKRVYRNHSKWTWPCLSILLASGYAIGLHVTGVRITNGEEPAWVNVLEPTNVTEVVRRVWTPHVGTSLLPAVITSVMLLVSRRERTGFAFVQTLMWASLSFHFIAALLVQPGFAIDVNNYFIKPAMYFSFIGLLAIVGQFHLSNRLAAAVGGVLVAILFASIPNSIGVSAFLENVDGLTRGVVDSNPASWGLVAGVGLLVACGLQFLRFHRVQEIEWLLGLALLSLIGAFSIGILLDRSSNYLPNSDQTRGERNSEFVTSVLGRPNLEAVGNWIQTNTERDVRFATNALCETYPQVDASMESGQLLCEVPGTDYTLGWTSQRLFLILGPRFAYENPDLRDKYMSASLMYGRSLAETERQNLVALGADIFVFDKRAGAGFATTEPVSRRTIGVIFENSDYAVIDLRE